MFPLPSTQTCEAGLLPEVKIPGFQYSAVPVISGMCTDTVCSFTPLVRVRGTNISPRVLHKHFFLHIQAKEARVWAEVEDRAHSPRGQGPKSVPTPSHHKLSKWINKLYRVCLCYLAYGQEYYLILVHQIHSSLHHV